MQSYRIADSVLEITYTVSPYVYDILVLDQFVIVRRIDYKAADGVISKVPIQNYFIQFVAANLFVPYNML